MMFVFEPDWSASLIPNLGSKPAAFRPLYFSAIILCLLVSLYISLYLLDQKVQLKKNKIFNLYVLFSSLRGIF